MPDKSNAPMFEAVAEIIESERAAALAREKALTDQIEAQAAELQTAQQRLDQLSDADPQLRNELKSEIDGLEARIGVLKADATVDRQVSKDALERLEVLIKNSTKDGLFESVVVSEITQTKAQIAAFVAETVRKRPKVLRSNPLVKDMPVAIAKFISEECRQ